MNVDQPLMHAHFKLFTRLFIDMRRPENRIERAFGRQRDGPRDQGPGPFGRPNDLLGGAIKRVVIVRLESNSDLLSWQWIILVEYSCVQVD